MSVSLCLSVSYQYYVTGIRLIRRPSRDIFCLYQILVHLSPTVSVSLSHHMLHSIDQNHFVSLYNSLFIYHCLVSLCLSVSYQYYVTGIRPIRQPSRDNHILFSTIQKHFQCQSLSVYLSLISTMLQVYV